MKTILSKSTASRLLIAGGILWLVSTFASWAILWNAYGQSGASLNDDEPTPSNLETFELIAGVNVYLAFLSYALLGLGLLLLVITSLRAKK